MPTKKKRVGFIPRITVLEIIQKLSFQNNLSNSKIINILVEEALSSRGILNIKTGNVNYKSSNSSIKEYEESIIKNPTKGINNNTNRDSTESNDLDSKKFTNEFIDSEVYEKFLLFLQFQEKMKKNNLN